MTNNDALDATTASLIAGTDKMLANATAASRYAAETNAMRFLPPAIAPRRTGKVRTARHTKRRTIR